MQSLRLWSFWQVLLVSGGWIVLCVVISAAWAVFHLRRQMSSGSGGIASVSAGITDPFLLFVALPPIVLVIAWLAMRWMSTADVN